VLQQQCHHCCVTAARCSLQRAATASVHIRASSEQEGHKSGVTMATRCLQRNVVVRGHWVAALEEELHDVNAARLAGGFPGSGEEWRGPILKPRRHVIKQQQLCNRDAVRAAG
jgi:hypothetical protein